MRGNPEKSEGRQSVSLGLGWSAVIEERPRGAMLRVQHPEQAPVTIEITITAGGPVIRATATALEIDAATDIVARCDHFAIEARESVSIKAKTIVQEAFGPMSLTASSVGVDAKSGGVTVHANDDVQLLGEQVLLNCDRDPVLPGWVPVAAATPVTLAPQDTAGDPELLGHK